MVKIVHDELASLMGGHAAGIEISAKRHNPNERSAGLRKTTFTANSPRS